MYERQVAVLQALEVPHHLRLGVIAVEHRVRKHRVAAPQLRRDAVAVARAHASLLAHTRRAGEPSGAHDLVIAATALASDRAVVSADAQAFERLPGLQFELRQIVQRVESERFQK